MLIHFFGKKMDEIALENEKTYCSEDIVDLPAEYINKNTVTENKTGQFEVNYDRKPLTITIKAVSGFINSCFFRDKFINLQMYFHLASQFRRLNK